MEMRPPLLSSLPEGARFTALPTNDEERAIVEVAIAEFNGEAEVVQAREAVGCGGWAWWALYKYGLEERVLILGDLYLAPHWLVIF